MAKQEARLKDRSNRPLIAIGTPKRLLEIIEKDPLLVHRTKRIVIDEVDKTLSPLNKRISAKKRTLRENHPRPAKVLVEQIKKYSRVIMCHYNYNDDDDNFIILSRFLSHIIKNSFEFYTC